MKKTLYKKPIYKKAAALFGVLLFSIINTSSAADMPSMDVGINIGDQAAKITVVNTLQQTETIKSLSGKKGLVLVFFRSADWCPFCKRHLIELNEIAHKFTALGYNQAGISYDSTKILQDFTAQTQLSFPLLSDQKAATFIEWGIMNKQYSAGDDNYGIPYPGVVVIDKNGIIIHRYFYQGYKKRAKFDELYQQLK